MQGYPQEPQSGAVTHPSTATQRSVGRARWFAVALIVLASIRPAHANTYLFSVNASDLLTALTATDSDESTSGYFAVMLQPSSITQSYSYGAITAPVTPLPAEAWSTGTITDFALGSGTFARFSKSQNQDTVALLSDDPLFAFDFYGTSYNDNLTWPEGWGTYSGVMQDQLASTDTFQFLVTTSQALGATSTVTGKAFSVWDGSGTYKTNTNIPLTVTASVTQVGSVPEPETWTLLASGALLLTVGQRIKNKHRSNKH